MHCVTTSDLEQYKVKDTPGILHWSLKYFVVLLYGQPFQETRQFWFSSYGVILDNSTEGAQMNLSITSPMWEQEEHEYQLSVYFTLRWLAYQIIEVFGSSFSTTCISNISKKKFLR